jgi:putative phosphoesterase
MTETSTDQAVIFGDIHGNLPALEAVFADLEAQTTGDRYCLGDLVGYGTFPNEVVEFVRDREIPTIVGNYDQGVGQRSDDCGCAYQDDADRERGKRSIAWTNEAITDANRAYLRDLKRQRRLTLGSLEVVLVHGSPRRVNEYLYANRADASFERMLDSVDADVLVCGHTHLPYHTELPSGRHVVNAGSVGKPKDGDPRACYAVLEAADGDVEVTFHRVSYDVERTASAIEATDMPDPYADMLRAGEG